jgi:hypothetical protein
MLDWKTEIGIAFLVRQKLFEVDNQRLWPFHYPEVAATEADLVEAESAIERKLDPHYREFLKYANGWKAFSHSVNLFGTKEFLGSTELTRANELLASVEPLEELCGIRRTDCLPIAVSMDSIDVFFIADENSTNPRRVFWVAGQVIEEYENFDEFFLGIVDLIRYDIEGCQKDRQA